MDYAGDDVWDAIEAAELLGKGLPPVAGGLLDQTNKFLSAARFIGAEQAKAREVLREKIDGR